MAKFLGYDIWVSEFALQSHYYIYFRTNTLGKVINLPYLSRYELNNILLFCYKDEYGIKEPLICH